MQLSMNLPRGVFSGKPINCLLKAEINNWYLQKTVHYKMQMHKSSFFCPNCSIKCKQPHNSSYYQSLLDSLLMLQAFLLAIRFYNLQPIHKFCLLAVELGISQHWPEPGWVTSGFHQVENMVGWGSSFTRAQKHGFSQGYRMFSLFYFVAFGFYQTRPQSPLMLGDTESVLQQMAREREVWWEGGMRRDFRGQGDVRSSIPWRPGSEQ